MCLPVLHCPTDEGQRAGQPTSSVGQCRVEGQRNVWLNWRVRKLLSRLHVIPAFAPVRTHHLAHGDGREEKDFWTSVTKVISVDRDYFGEGRLETFFYPASIAQEVCCNRVMTLQGGRIYKVHS